MKSITGILGGSQILLGMSYDIQDIFEDYLSKNHRAFLTMLSVVEDSIPYLERDMTVTGRRPYDTFTFFRAYLAKSFFKLTIKRGLIDRLISDSSLRKICGFVNVPSDATFSRYLQCHSQTNIME